PPPPAVHSAVAAAPPPAAPEPVPAPAAPEPVTEASVPAIEPEAEPEVSTPSPAEREPVAVSVGVGDDLDRLVTDWPTIVGSVRPATRAVLTECRPIAVDGNVVTLGFPEAKAFLKDHAERRRTEVEAVVGGHLGREVSVRSVATNIEVAPLVAADDLVAEARRIFGEDLVDVAEVDGRRRPPRATDASVRLRRGHEEGRTRWAWATCSAWRSRCSRRCCASRRSSRPRRSTARLGAASSVRPSRASRSWSASPSTHRSSTPKMSRCSRTWSSPRSTTPFERHATSPKRRWRPCPAACASRGWDRRAG